MSIEFNHDVNYVRIGKYEVSSELFLDLVFNNKCNFKCPFCIAETKDFCKENYKNWKENLRQIFNIFDVRDIIILGGESTIDPLFFEKLDFLKEVIKDRNIDNIILTTNGSMLRYKFFLERLAKSCITGVNLSYMNSDKEKNDFLMRGKTLCKEELKEIYKTLKKNNIAMRLNCNIYKENISTTEEMEKYVEELSGYADAIKFSPLMITDMFDTKACIKEYSNKQALPEEEVRKLYNEFANKHNIINQNEGVFGLIEYKEVEAFNQKVILKYQQVEDKYDLDRVIPTLKLYSNGNLSNEWNYKKNILQELERTCERVV